MERIGRLTAVLATVMLPWFEPFALPCPVISPTAVDVAPAQPAPATTAP